VRRRNRDLVGSGTRYAERRFLAQSPLYCLGEADGAGETETSGEADAAGEGLATLALGLGAGLGEDSVFALGAGEALALTEACGDADAAGETEARGAAGTAALRTSFSKTPVLCSKLRRAVSTVSNKVTPKKMHPR
jgi:hypothetical protein